MVALITPVLIAESSFGAYYLFAFASLFCTLMVAMFMVETRGHSLEEIEQTYNENKSRVASRRTMDCLRLRRVRATAA